MTEKQRKYLQWQIEDEGLDYALRWKSNDIKDPEFNRLLADYTQAAKKIEEYINNPDRYKFLKDK